MKENTFQNLTDEQLLKKRNQTKGVLIGAGIVIILVIAAAVYLLVTKQSEKNPVSLFLPVFILPVTFMPLVISWSLLNKEMKNRNLK